MTGEAIWSNPTRSTSCVPMTRTARWRAWVLLAAGVIAAALGALVYAGLVAGGGATHASALPNAALSGRGIESLPLAARGAISASLGAESAAYRVRTARGGELLADNPAQRLRVSFGNTGVSVESGGARVGLSVIGAGFGSALGGAGHGAPQARENRVVYDLGGLSAWYVNGPVGLEQGFTLRRPPAGEGSGPLTVALGLSGPAGASLAKGGRSVLFKGGKRTLLRYGQLRVTDARGHVLRSWMALEGRRLLLRAEATRANYPLRIDPFIQQGGTLEGSGRPGVSHFGVSAALSADGNTALIGAPGDDSNVGAVWVFTRSGEAWTQQGPKLTVAREKNGFEPFFGAHLTLSADGNTALVSSGGNNDDRGAAYVFTRSGETWTQQAKLTGTGLSSQALFAASVALSPDGNTALIGSNEDFPGQAWIFTRSAGKWSQQGEPISKENAFLGDSVALSADAHTLLLGGGKAVFVYVRSEGGWSQQAELVGTGIVGQVSGTRVALSADGNTALIGGLEEENKHTGAAWVFTRSEGAWSQQSEKLTGSASPFDGFGDSVSLSEDGNTALIGADGAGEGGGQAYVFTRSEGNWSQDGEPLTGGGGTPKGSFGAAVALSPDGQTALIGGPDDSSPTGAAWAFSRSGEAWTQQGQKFTGAGATPAGENYRVAIARDGNTVLVASSESSKTGAAWIFAREGETWTQQSGKLTGNGETGAHFGSAPALSADGSTAVIGAPGEHGTGAIYVFTRSEGAWTQQGEPLTVPHEGFLGESVAVSDDGDTVLAGDSLGAPGGVAYVFTRAGETWTQQGEGFTGSEQKTKKGREYFGSSVALSADGDTALIGSYSDNKSKGAAWVFTRTGETWSQQGSKLIGHGESGSGGFGMTMALSSDGNTALVGGTFDKKRGAAWVFTRSGGAWSQQGGKLVPSKKGTKYAEFGRGIALSADGDTALISAPDQEVPGSAVYEYTRSASTWTLHETFTGHEGDLAMSGDGSTVVIGAGQGALVLVGQP